jgi:DNA helicase MCM8
MLRRYIAFAKHYVHPKLSKAACKELQAFYIELRQKGDMCDSTPITTRQLESLIRLAQARAKLELRSVVTAADAKDVVSLMRDSLTDSFTDVSGVVDMGRAGGMSTARIGKTLISQLKRAARERGDPVFTVEQMKEEARRAKIYHHIEDFPQLVDVLNQQCYLLKKGPQLYRLPVSNFD